MIRVAPVIQRHLGAALGLCVVLASVALAQLPGLPVETDGRILFPSDHPALVSERAFEARYGRTDPLLVMLEAPREGGLFDPAPLAAVFDLTSLSMESEGVDTGSVKSLSTTVVPHMTAQGLRVAPLLSQGSLGLEDAKRLETLAAEDPLLVGRLVSQDRRAAAIYLPLEAGADQDAVLAELRERFAAALAAKPQQMVARITGPAVAQSQLARHIVDDLVVRLPIAIALVGLALWAWFRSMAVVAIGLGQIALVILVCFGAMGLAERPLTLVTTIMPLILTAYCLADTIHIGERLRTLRAAGTPSNAPDLLRRIFVDLSRPIVVTSLTTATGFLAFTFSPLPPVRDFGVFVALGVGLSLVLSLFLVVPLILRFCDLGSAGGGWRPGLGQSIGRLSLSSSRHPLPVLAGLAVVLCVSVLGLAQLRVQDSWINNFDRSSSIVQDHERFNDLFFGTDFINVTLTAERDGFWYLPESLKALEHVEATLRELPEVGGTLSPASQLAALARVLEGAARLPTSSDESRQWLLLRMMAHGPGSDDDLLLSDDGRRAVLRLQLTRGSYASSEAVLQRLCAALSAHVALAGTTSSLSGNAFLGHQLVASIGQSQHASLAAALFGIAAIVFLRQRSLVRSAVVMLPVSCTVLGVFGFMGWSGIPIGVATSTFAAIALGMGVDFALHWIERFDLIRAGSLSIDDAIAATATQTGLALSLHCAVMVAGFAVLLFSPVPPIRSLGLLLCVSLAIALAATLVLLPACVALVNRKRAPHGQLYAAGGR